MKAYIVQTVISSPNRQLGTEEIDDKTVKINYMFKKEVRQKIAAIRMKYKAPIYSNTLNFYGIYICREDEKNRIKQHIEEADKELKAIDPSLSARVCFIPLDLVEISKGELYSQILYSINYKILKDVVDKLNNMSIKDTLTERSKMALLSLINRLKLINVLNDSEIDSKLNSIREKILNQDIHELKQELEADLKAIRSRASHLEL